MNKTRPAKALAQPRTTRRQPANRKNSLTLQQLRNTSGEERWRLIHDWIWKQVRSRKTVAGMQRLVRTLPRGMRALWATYELDCEVRNGGFLQYFSNASSRLADEAAAGFTLFGRRDLADTLRAARKLAVQHAPSIRKLRADRLDENSEAALRAAFDEVNDAYFRLIRKRPTPQAAQDRWIESHLTEFVIE